MADYMTANSDYGVMLPLQALPPLSPHTSPAHAVHPLTIHNGGMHMSPQHLATVSSVHEQHKPLGTAVIGQHQHQPQHQLGAMHHLPVMTNNSLYATGALSAALMLPQYPQQPDPNQAYVLYVYWKLSIKIG